jgi:hypothetical protein
MKWQMHGRYHAATPTSQMGFQIVSVVTVPVTNRVLAVRVRW